MRKYFQVMPLKQPLERSSTTLFSACILHQVISELSNLSACTIKESDVVFNDLNAIAWLVEIKK